MLQIHMKLIPNASEYIILFFKTLKVLSKVDNIVVQNT